MDANFIQLIEHEIEERAVAKAAQMFEEWKNRHGVPSVPIDVAQDGRTIKPFLIGGVKFISRKDAASLLGVSLTVLWRWTEKQNLLQKRKIGQKVYFLYDDVVNFACKEKGGEL
ncbi:MAG: helix-turn-helix domain-containing protein [Prevotella sp.]|nr:helix-turn-helix domain-containing protein [Prevotella sp.]